MNKKYAIFDMDGTLVDSMAFWDRLAEEYLHYKGVKEVPAYVLERLAPMTLEESAELFRITFGLPGTAESLMTEMSELMDGHYRIDVPLKPGAKEYLQSLSERGVKMCVASATPEDLMKECLERVGVLDLFSFVLSCDSVGTGKDRPDVFHEASRILGASCPGDVAVYEDAVYAVRTAKNAGYYLVAIYDKSSEAHWQEIERLADESYKSWEDILPEFKK